MGYLKDYSVFMGQGRECDYRRNSAEAFLLAHEKYFLCSTSKMLSQVFGL